MNSYRITYRHGLQNPVVLEANDVEDAKKRGLTHHLKNSGYDETVDLKSTIANVIESVMLVD